MAKQTSFVFLSYSSLEVRFVEKLSRDLDQAKVKNWYARLIPGGSVWFLEVQKRLTECSTVVCVLSPNWVTSEFSLKEAAYAIRKNKRPVPILYKPCDPPYLLEGCQYIDLRKDYRAGLEELVQALKAPKSSASSKKSPKKRPSASGQPKKRPAQPSAEKPVALPAQGLTDIHIAGGQQDAAWQGMMANLRPQEIAVERAVGAAPNETPAQLAGQDGPR